MGRDLRRTMAFYALQWCRSTPFLHTCAKSTLHLRQVALEEFAVAEEVEGAGAVGKLDAVEAKRGIIADGPLDDGEGLFAVVIAEYERFRI